MNAQLTRHSADSTTLPLIRAIHQLLGNRISLPYHAFINAAVTTNHATYMRTRSVYNVRFALGDR